MSLVTLDVLKDKSAKVGDIRDWRYSNSPVTGDVWGVTERLRGAKYSVGHKRSPDGKYRTGGPFFTTKFHTFQEGTASDTYRVGSWIAYSGRYYLVQSWIHSFSHMNMWGNDTDTINSRAYAYGAQALAKLRPDRPDFSPLVSLAELLREAPGIHEDFKKFNERYYSELRRLKQRQIFLSRTARWHLAMSFGFAPIVSDIQNWVTAYNGAQKRAQQLLRDNGKWVRRSAYLSARPDENYSGFSTTQYTTPYNPDMRPTLVTQCYGGGMASTQHSERKYVQVWCAGASKYWLPDDLVNAHYGLKKLQRRTHADFSITPEALYNLIPWSWLLDYFTSLGSFFAALSGGISDRLVFKYAYVMRTDYHDSKTVCTQYIYKNRTSASAGPITCTVNRVGVLKTRVAASIFGFGLKESDLSSRQLGILGALGYSRLGPS